VVVGAVVALRVTAQVLTVRPKAFEQALNERLASRQACCAVGVGFSREPLGMLLASCAVSSVVTKGHCLPPASSGLIAKCTGRVVEVAVGDPPPKEMLTAEVTATPAHIRPTRLALTTTDIS
jgi:hypothetical protein